MKWDAGKHPIFSYMIFKFQFIERFENGTPYGPRAAMRRI
jgi:hypothetical protein